MSRRKGLKFRVNTRLEWLLRLLWQRWNRKNCRRASAIASGRCQSQTMWSSRNKCSMEKDLPFATWRQQMFTLNVLLIPRKISIQLDPFDIFQSINAHLSRIVTSKFPVLHSPDLFDEKVKSRRPIRTFFYSAPSIRCQTNLLISSVYWRENKEERFSIERKMGSIPNESGCFSMYRRRHTDLLYRLVALWKRIGLKASQVKGNVCVDWGIIYCFTSSQFNPIAAHWHVTLVLIEIANDAIRRSSGGVLEHCSEQSLNLLFLNQFRQSSQRTADCVTEKRKEAVRRDFSIILFVTRHKRNIQSSRRATILISSEHEQCSCGSLSSPTFPKSFDLMDQPRRNRDQMYPFLLRDPAKQVFCSLFFEETQ